MSDRLSLLMTHEEFAAIVGVSRQAVDDLARRGVLRRGAPAGEWLLAYTGKLREEAAGRSVELTQERARYDRARADHQEMVNEERRGKLVKTAMLEEILVEVARRIAGILERVDVRLRREAGLDAKARSVVQHALVQARNEAATLTLPLEELAEDVRRREELLEGGDGSVGDRAGNPPRPEAAGGGAAAAAQPVG